MYENFVQSTTYLNTEMRIQVDKISSFALEIFAKFLQANPVCFDALQLVSLSEPFEETALLRFLAAVPNVKNMFLVSGRYPSAIKKQVLKCLHENYCIEYICIAFDDEVERFASICNRNKYLANQKRFVKTKPMALG